MREGSNSRSSRQKAGVHASQATASPSAIPNRYIASDVVAKNLPARPASKSPRPSRQSKPTPTSGPAVAAFMHARCNESVSVSNRKFKAGVLGQFEVRNSVSS
jgi:hypothetical protein